MSSIKTLTKLAKITANIKALNDVESSLLKLIEMEFSFHLIETCQLKTVIRRIPTYGKFDKLKEKLYKKFDEMEKDDKENKAAEEKKKKRSDKKRPASTSGQPPAKRKAVVKDQKTTVTKKTPRRPPPVISTAFAGFRIPKKQKSTEFVASKPEEKPAVSRPVSLLTLKVEKPAWF